MHYLTNLRNQIEIFRKENPLYLEKCIILGFFSLAESFKIYSCALVIIFYSIDIKGNSMGLSFTKLFSRLSGKKEIGLLMVGLNTAGKTTILNKLKLGKTIATDVTIGFNMETLEYRNINFIIWEIGGQTKIQLLPKFYFQNVQGIIFVVDSNDQDRVVEARDDLQMLLNEDELKNSVLLVFANKQDLPNAMSAPEIADKLGLTSLHQHRWHIQSTCAISGEGLGEGMDWLSTNLL